MQVIDIGRYQNSFVLHYGGKKHSLDAKVFAESLIEITTILQEISYFNNPDCIIEVRIEALADGSFRTAIHLYWSRISAAVGGFKEYLPAKKETIPVLISLLALYAASGNQNNVRLEGNNNAVIINQGDHSVVVSKDIYEQATKLATNKVIKRAVSSHFRALNLSPEIENFGITDELDSQSMDFHVAKSGFLRLSEISENVEEPQSEEDKVEYGVELKLVKVILQKGKRRWSFVWNGIEISAPILDDAFWFQLEHHEIEISQGDTIVADLRILRKYDVIAKVYINVGYEVIKVSDYKKVYKQKGNLFDEEYQVSKASSDKRRFNE